MNAPCMPLARYAELRADVDAGLGIDAVLDREGLDGAQWRAAQSHWLAAMAGEVRRQRADLQRQYQAAYAARQPHLLGLDESEVTPPVAAAPAAPPVVRAADALAPPIVGAPDALAAPSAGAPDPLVAAPARLPLPSPPRKDAGRHFASSPSEAPPSRPFLAATPLEPPAPAHRPPATPFDARSSVAATPPSWPASIPRAADPTAAPSTDGPRDPLAGTVVAEISPLAAALPFNPTPNPTPARHEGAASPPIASPASARPVPSAAATGPVPDVLPVDGAPPWLRTSATTHGRGDDPSHDPLAVTAAGAVASPLRVLPFAGAAAEPPPSSLPAMTADPHEGPASLVAMTADGSILSPLRALPFASQGAPSPGSASPGSASPGSASPGSASPGSAPPAPSPSFQGSSSYGAPSHASAPQPSPASSLPFAPRLALVGFALLCAELTVESHDRAGVLARNRLTADEFAEISRAWWQRLREDEKASVRYHRAHDDFVKRLRARRGEP